MDISPQAISTASFPVVKKGFDPDHVRSFLGEVGRALEAAQNQSTAMEARARAAVAKLQELTQATAKAPDAATPSVIPSDDAETISRTLLIAQKAADTTIAEARIEADTMVSAARAEAANVMVEARRQAAQYIEDARSEARRSSEADKQKVESEVQALLARREFLLSDVEHLDEFVGTQRRRIQDVAALLQEVAERGPGGLGDVRRPLLSAADGAGPSEVTMSTVSELWEADNEPQGSSSDSAIGMVDVVTAPVEVPADIRNDAYDDLLGEDDATLITDSFAPTTASPIVESDEPDDLPEELIQFEETEPTPPQSPALLDFDGLDTTSEIPIIGGDDR